MSTRSAWASVAIGIMLAACGGGSTAPADGPPAASDAMPDAASDAMPDAAVDAMPDAGPPPVLALDVDAGDGPITTWRFPATAVGQRAAVTLVVSNPGVTTTDVLGVSLVGAGAGDFAIVIDGSTCDGRALPPGDPCVVRLAFAPTVAAPRTAALRFTAGGARLDLGLDGDGVAATPGLIADATSIDFGAVELARRADAGVVLRNTGAGGVTLGARTASAGFAIVSDDCPATLAPGAGCTVVVGFTPTTVGLTAGALDATSSGASVHVALAGLGLRRITIVVSGTGAGTITSVPGGIDCGATCSALFFGAVTLTATVADPAYASRWGPPCGIDATCVVPAGDSLTIDAGFDTIAPTVTVTMAGSGRGYVLLVDTQAQVVLATCAASCATSFLPGTPVTAYAFTPSTFTGWTGACTGISHACDLGALDRNLAVTATFDRDEREVATVLPRAAVTGLALAPDGDVVIADGAGVSKVGLGGAIAWTAPIAGGASDLAVDAAGDVFGRGGGGLFALSPTGAPAWTRAFATAAIPGLSMESAVAASTDGRVIAVLTGDGAHVVDGTGTDRFVASGLGGGFGARGVAVAPDGTVAIAVLSDAFPGQVEVVRYDAAGAALAAVDPLDGDVDVSIAYDPSGYLCTATTGFGGAAVARFAPDLGKAFAHFEATGAPADLPAAVTADAAGEVVFLRERYGAGPVPGFQLEVFSPAGAISWTHTKVPVGDDGITPIGLAARDHHVAVAGTIDSGDLPSIHLPWIQIDELP